MSKRVAAGPGALPSAAAPRRGGRARGCPARAAPHPGAAQGVSRSPGDPGGAPRVCHLPHPPQGVAASTRVSRAVPRPAGGRGGEGPGGRGGERSGGVAGRDALPGGAGRGPRWDVAGGCWDPSGAAAPRCSSP